MGHTLVNYVKYIPMKNKLNSRIVFFGLIVAIVLIVLYHSFGTVHLTNVPASGFAANNFTQHNSTELAQINKAKECYALNVSVANLQFLDDIELSPPKPDKSIFFTDTSCYNNGRFTLSARKACAIESAAKLHPNRDVYLLFVAPVGFVPNEPDSPVMAALKSYPNVHFRHVDIYNFSRNTPAEQWIKQDQMFSASLGFLPAHLSDYLRFGYLYKFGGIYFDLDVIIIKNLDSLPPNFLAREIEVYINSTPLGFTASGIGHQIVELIFRECFENYNAAHWDYNGPYAVLRAMKKICRKTKILDMTPEFCWGCKIMPPKTFYPIGGMVIKDAFDTNSTQVEKQLKKITNETMSVHFWGRTAKLSILKSAGSNFYTIFAQKYCPKSYEASGLYFD